MKKLIYIAFFICISANAQYKVAALLGPTKGQVVTPPVDNGITPQLSNWIAIGDKLHFDSNEEITASTFSGFTIEGHTITSITIDSDGLGGHFTTSTPFTYWNFGLTIRYEGGSNMVDVTGNGMHDFTMVDIVNNTIRPSADTYRYVTTSGSDSNGGTNDTTDAWLTINHGANTISAGTTLWVKAGDYGDAPINLAGSEDSGTLSAPKVIKGYKNVIGDLDGKVFYKYGDGAFDTSAAPTLDGGNFTDSGVDMNNVEYVIFENFQIERYQHGIDTGGSTGSRYMSFDNIVVKDCGDINSSVSAYCMTLNNGTVYGYVKVSNSLLINGTAGGLRVWGDHNLIDNVKVYADNQGGSSESIFDYYISLYDNSYSVVKNCHVERVDNTITHGGHGISIKSDGAGDNSYNLLKNNTVKGIGFAIEFRHDNTKNNVCDGLIALGSPGMTSNAITFRDNCSYNIAKNIIGSDLTDAIVFWDQDSEEGEQNGGDNNKVINGSFLDIVDFISTTVSGGHSGNDINTNNSFEYITIKNVTNVFNTTSLLDFDGANSIQNSIIENATNYKTGAGTNDFTVTNTNFHNNGFSAPSGTGNIAVNPFLYFDLALTSQTPISVYEGGADLGIFYDLDGRERKAPYSMGAFQKYSTDIYPDYFVSATGTAPIVGSTALSPASFANLDAYLPSLLPGEIVGFKSGDTFNNDLNNSGCASGTDGNHIVFTSYGVGAKPIINVHRDRSPTWTDTGGNIWTTTASYGRRVTKNGVEMLAAVDLTELSNSATNGTEYYHTGSTLSVYSTSDPDLDTFAWNESTFGENLRLTNAAYITIDGLAFRGGNEAAITIRGGSSHDWLIKNCDIGELAANGVKIDNNNCHDIVVEDNNIDAHFTVDMSNITPGGTGIDVRSCFDGLVILGGHDVTIRRNTFKNWGHTGFAAGTTTLANRMYNVHMHDNDISCPDILYGRGIGYSGYFEDSEFYNNNIHDTWTQNQLGGSRNHFHDNIIDTVNDSPLKSGPLGIGIMVVNSGDVQIVNNIIENNIIRNTAQQGIYLYSINSGSGEVTGNIIRGNILENCFDPANGSVISLDFHKDEVGQSIYNNVMENNSISHPTETQTCRYLFGGSRYTPENFNSQDLDISGNLTP